MRRSLSAAAFALALGVGCTSTPSTVQSSTTAAEAGAPQVEAVAVVEQVLSTTIQLEGELSPFEFATLDARANGFVQRVNVDRGSRVKAGEVLVTIVAPELASQRAEAEVRLQANKATYERLRAASQVPGAVAQDELERAGAAFHADESQVQSLRTAEQYLTVTAPFDGVITERNVHPGALVGPQSGKPMLRLEQVTKLRLTIPVPEALAGDVHEGLAATFTVLAWPGEQFHAATKRISHSIDVKTRSMPVELDVDNSDGKLASGMFANVQWPVKMSAPSAFVPASAIVTTTESTFVVRLKDGVIEHVTVRRGMTSADLVQVYGDLHGGELVAKRGSEELRVGSRASFAVSGK